MKRKIIRNWKVIKNNLDFNLAFNLYKSHKIDGVDYPIIGLRLAPSQFIQSGVDIINDIKLSPSEAISNKWEIVIPDNDAEEKTNKLRQMLKDKNFTGLRYDKIDNMSIDEMFNTILHIMDNLDKDNKYRIAKHIIENELYKKI
jgi:hypothetical protein